MVQALHFLVCRRIPQPRSVVITRGGELLLAVGAKYNLGYAAVMQQRMARFRQFSSTGKQELVERKIGMRIMFLASIPNKALR
jgi:hypothetical protein